MSTNMNVKKIITILLTTLVLFTHSLAAEPADQQISKQQAIALVKDNFGGKVLKIDLVEKPKASFYKVKLLTNQGRVKQVRVDSRTGNIL
tara:strand:- start:74 stop:343 length:270 start_codon:yes stop_codon:yes gene_type:complete